MPARPRDPVYDSAVRLQRTGCGRHGSCGALGSAVTEAFVEAGATVAACDVVPIDSEDSQLDPADGIEFYQADFTDESAVAETVDRVVADHGRIDYLLNIAGTWRGG
jgi:Dehydrogenases with different specificities (related to short-chain alcohol dehydrogenases)